MVSDYRPKDPWRLSMCLAKSSPKNKDNPNFQNNGFSWCPAIAQKTHEGYQCVRKNPAQRWHQIQPLFEDRSTKIKSSLYNRIKTQERSSPFTRKVVTFHKTSLQENFIYSWICSLINAFTAKSYQFYLWSTQF